MNNFDDLLRIMYKNGQISIKSLLIDNTNLECKLNQAKRIIKKMWNCYKIGKIDMIMFNKIIDNIDTRHLKINKKQINEILSIYKNKKNDK